MLDWLLRKFGRLRWLRTGIKYRLIRRLGRKDGEFTTDYFGYSYWGQFSSFIDWQVFYFGGYSLMEMDLLASIINGNSGWVAVDVGANNGVHSLFLSKLCRHVHAFEPFPPVAEKLRRRIFDNSIKNITLHSIALGARNESRSFYSSTNSNEGIGTFDVETRTIKDKALYGTLEIRLGDSYFEILGIDKVDLIKIDAEGMEFDVLNGLQKTIERFRPVIFLELCEGKRRQFRSAEDLKNELPKNYTVYRCIFSRPKLVFFETTAPEKCGYDFMPGDQMLLLLPSRRLADSAQEAAKVQPLRND